jgi:nucleoside-diphosphate-sugar epimerase
MDAPARFLVTGAQGFVGRYLVHALLASYPEATVVGIGRSPATSESFTHSLQLSGRSFRAPLPADLRINDRYRYCVADLLDPTATKALVGEVEPDAVFHLASGLKGDPVDRLMRSGVEATVRLMEALGSAGSRHPRVIVCSSGGVYGAVPEHLLPITEDSWCKPADLYGASKLAAEHACRILAEQHAICVVYARLFNLVGPGQDERHVCGRFVAQAVAISRGLQPAEMQTGALESTRDFIDVRDGVRALLLLAAAGSPGETYNVASGVEARIGSVLDTVLEQTGLRGQVLIVSRQSDGGIRRHYASIARLVRLGFRTERSLQESLRDIRNYYLEHIRHFA